MGMEIIRAIRELNMVPQSAGRTPYWFFTGFQLLVYRNPKPKLEIAGAALIATRMVIQISVPAIAKTHILAIQIKMLSIDRSTVGRGSIVLWELLVTCVTILPLLGVNTVLSSYLHAYFLFCLFFISIISCLCFFYSFFFALKHSYNNKSFLRTGKA